MTKRLKVSLSRSLPGRGRDFLVSPFVNADADFAVQGDLAAQFDSPFEVESHGWWPLRWFSLRRAPVHEFGAKVPERTTLVERAEPD
ncbi:MAG: hypothetical protein Kow0069_07980 [Promethearchaeota archaeon]